MEYTLPFMEEFKQAVYTLNQQMQKIEKQNRDTVAQAQMVAEKERAEAEQQFHEWAQNAAGVIHACFPNNAYGKKSRENAESLWHQSERKLPEQIDRFAQIISVIERRMEDRIQEAEETRERELSVEEQAFLTSFPPQELLLEYRRLGTEEPDISNFVCANSIPLSVHVASLDMHLKFEGLSPATLTLLRRNYPYLFQERIFSSLPGHLSFPGCFSLREGFRLLFHYTEAQKEQVVMDACAMVLRLFMMLPPGKLRVTFIDPESQGGSFAMFTRIVDMGNRSSEIISRQIWSDATDIEQQFRLLNARIANVTQRCLQGRFDNIYEYNREARQNAEAYQILVMMDAPSHLTDNAIQGLEQIVTTGPKCGVFAILYENADQMSKLRERSLPLWENMKKKMTSLYYTSGGTPESTLAVSSDESMMSEEEIERMMSGIEEHYLCTTLRGLKKGSIQWTSVPLPTSSELNPILKSLRQGIENSDRVVIDIRETAQKKETPPQAVPGGTLEKSAETIGVPQDQSARFGIKIPIGRRGAGEEQYLTLGQELSGVTHAILVGQTGSGKSSLLHTIILQTLRNYSPDQVRLYLIDFKEGVEFQKYAAYPLPSFRVVSIETVAEFGINVLRDLKEEQQKRGDLFRELDIHGIEEYPQDAEEPMPRIFVIMDEIQELLTNPDQSEEASRLIETIVRQGRSFGIHLLFSSQSYSNIHKLSQAVIDQIGVRIALKCSPSDADRLLQNGADAIEQISNRDPGRGIYNSGSGVATYNTIFKAYYIEPDSHNALLEEISAVTSSFVDEDHPTRILLSHIEDNHASYFNRFADPNFVLPNAELFLGESLTVENQIRIRLPHSDFSNLMFCGNDEKKARTMFTFSLLSLAIRFYVSHGGTTPEVPFISLLNYKPLRDRRFPDYLKNTADALSQYVRSVPTTEPREVRQCLEDLHRQLEDTADSTQDRYLFIFGYQTGIEDLRAERQMTGGGGLFSRPAGKQSTESLSSKALIEALLDRGPQKGIHIILWQDSFTSLDQMDREFIARFYHKIGFNMTLEDISAFIPGCGDDVKKIREDNAVYARRGEAPEVFRPYLAPRKAWLKEKCDILGKS